MNRLAVPSLRQVLFIEDGHLMNHKLGSSYHSIDLVQRDYAIPLVENHFDQPQTWQISAPQLSLLRCHDQDKFQFAKLFTILRNETQIPSMELMRRGPSHIYLLMGGFDAALMHDLNLPISQFMTAMLIFCEQIHKIFPHAEICWLGPGVWHALSSIEEKARIMHEAIYLLPTYKPYVKAFDITLDSSSSDFSGTTGFWTYPYLQKQVYKLRKLFTFAQKAATHEQLLQESNLIQVPLFVKIPYLVGNGISQMALTANVIPAPQPVRINPRVNNPTALMPSHLQGISVPLRPVVQVSPLNLALPRTLLHYQSEYPINRQPLRTITERQGTPKPGHRPPPAKPTIQIISSSDSE